jgi:hypothetical protein
MTDHTFAPVIFTLEQQGISIVDLATVILMDKNFVHHYLRQELLTSSQKLISCLLKHSELPQDAKDEAFELVECIYAQEIKNLTMPSAGWHFSALHAAPQDIKDFWLEEMANDFAKKALRLWSLLDALLLPLKQSVV